MLLTQSDPCVEAQSALVQKQYTLVQKQYTLVQKQYTLALLAGAALAGRLELGTILFSLRLPVHAGVELLPDPVAVGFFWGDTLYMLVLYAGQIGFTVEQGASDSHKDDAAHKVSTTSSAIEMEAKIHVCSAALPREVTFRPYKPLSSQIQRACCSNGTGKWEARLACDNV